MDFKRAFQNKEKESIFYKTTAGPAVGSADKAVLNRKGNLFFNNGDIESARRIFLTTGYSDGIVRVGDYYKTNGRIMDALQMYWIAPDRVKAEKIIINLSTVIKSLISGDQKNG
ncbi:MAG: hypothetical protein FWF22_06860 [Treponema sp.]|nr:hypothetical protein [Treponema sp.]